MKKEAFRVITALSVAVTGCTAHPQPTIDPEILPSPITTEVDPAFIPTLPPLTEIDPTEPFQIVPTHTYTPLSTSTPISTRTPTPIPGPRDQKGEAIATPIGAKQLIQENGQWVALNKEGKPGWTFNLDTLVWEEAIKSVDLIPALGAKGVIFPEDTTNIWSERDRELAVRFSKGVFEKSGIDYVQFREEPLENFYYQVMGKYMFMQRTVYPERYYNDFKDIEQQVYEDYAQNRYGWAGADGVFIDIARRQLDENGPADLRFRDYPMEAKVNKMEFNMVSKAEFDTVMEAARETGVPVAHPHHALTGPYVNMDYAIYFDGGKLVAYGYHISLHEADTKNSGNFLPLPATENLSTKDNVHFKVTSITTFLSRSAVIVSTALQTPKDSVEIPRDSLYLHDTINGYRPPFYGVETPEKKASVITKP